jgi:hypothetical protein
MIVETNKNASTGKYEVDIKTTGVVAELETNKEVTITENGTIAITPSSGKDAMKKVTATVNVSTTIKSLAESNPGLIQLSSDSDGYPDTPEYSPFGEVVTLPAGTYLVADGYFIANSYDLPTLISEFFSSGVTCTLDSYSGKYKIVVENDYTVVDGNPFSGGMLFIGAVNREI